MCQGIITPTSYYQGRSNIKGPLKTTHDNQPLFTTTKNENRYNQIDVFPSFSLCLFSALLESRRRIIYKQTNSSTSGVFFKQQSKIDKLLYVCISGFYVKLKNNSQ